MSLVENTTYNKMNAVMPAVVKAAYKVGEALPPKVSPKAVDISQYQNVADTVSRSTPQQAPAGSNNGFQEGANVGLGTVTTPYGGGTRFESFHPGIDIANSIGTAIKAFTPGVVTEVDTGYKQGDKGTGNSIVIRDAQGNLQRYSHLYGTYVKVGQEVGQGTEIGTMGNSGSTYSLSGGTGSHLDYRVKNIYGKYINPTGFIK